MKVIKLEVGHIGTNCYIVFCEETKEAAVIDPGGNEGEILGIIAREKLKVPYIINTHGHADHIEANSKIKNATGAAILIHQNDAQMLVDARGNLSAFFGNGVVTDPADRILSDGDTIDIGSSIHFKVLHTPGHTPGGISLLSGNVLFSGDTLFAESVGRTDFPGGSYQQLLKSIKEKLMVLDDDVQVLPGHGPGTTIGWERKMNPFIQ